MLLLHNEPVVHVDAVRLPLKNSNKQQLTSDRAHHSPLTTALNTTLVRIRYEYNVLYTITCVFSEEWRPRCLVSCFVGAQKKTRVCEDPSLAFMGDHEGGFVTSTHIARLQTINIKGILQCCT